MEDTEPSSISDSAYSLENLAMDRIHIFLKQISSSFHSNLGTLLSIAPCYFSRIILTKNLKTWKKMPWACQKWDFLFDFLVKTSMSGICGNNSYDVHQKMIIKKNGSNENLLPPSGGSECRSATPSIRTISSRLYDLTKQVKSLLQRWPN